MFDIVQRYRHTVGDGLSITVFGEKVTVRGERVNLDKHITNLREHKVALMQFFQDAHNTTIYLIGNP